MFIALVRFATWNADGVAGAVAAILDQELTWEWISCVKVYKEEKKETGSLIVLGSCILAQDCLLLDLFHMRENF